MRCRYGSSGGVHYGRSLSTFQHVVERNTVTPEILSFVMQGTNKLYITFKPYFHKVRFRL